MRERERFNQLSEGGILTFRLDPSGYVPVCFGAFLSLLFAFIPFIPLKDGSPRNTPDFLVLWGIGGVFLLVALYGLFWMLQARIVATEDGLRWIRPMLPERRLAWGEITDYYTELRSRDITSGTLGESLAIVSARGIWRVSMHYLDWDTLKATIALRASNARVEQWDRFGTRTFDDFPRVFRYWNSDRQVQFVKSAIGFAVIWAGFAAAGWNAVLATVAKIGWQDTLPAFVGGSVLWLAFAYIPFGLLSDYGEAWKRRGESITATPDAVRYENQGTGEVVDSSWQDVVDYYYRVRKGGLERDEYALVLRGVDEKQIVWTGLIQDKSLLLALIKRYAPSPLIQETSDAWRAKGANETTGGSDPTTWQSGAVGMGGRVFHYRTFESKLVLVMLTGVFSSLVGISVVREWLEPEHGQLIQCLRMVVPTVILPLIWFWTCFLRTRVETDDIGITHYTPLGKRFLPWFAVADYTDVRGKNNVKGDPLILTGRDGKKMYFWSTLNGYGELRGEIERYAPPPKTGWTPAK